MWRIHGAFGSEEAPGRCFFPVLLKNKNLMYFHLLLSFWSRENVIAGSHFQEVNFGSRKETNFLW